MIRINKLKRRIIALVAIIFSLSGCDDKTNDTEVYVSSDHYCTPDSSERRAEFILTCILNANPKSDEEPEDWITKCQDMAEETLCPVVFLEITRRCTVSTFGSCDYWKEQSRKPVTMNEKG